jgi:hypothetical protein
VKSTQLSEGPEFEVDEVPVSEKNAHDGPQSSSETLAESVGTSCDEVIDHFLPPASHGGNEFGQVLVAAGVDFENPSRKGSGGFLSAVDFLVDIRRSSSLKRNKGLGKCQYIVLLPWPSQSAS